MAEEPRGKSELHALVAHHLRLDLVAGSFALGVLVAVLVAAAQSPAPAFDPGAGSSALNEYGKLPLSVIPNSGQVDRRVRYYAQGAGHAFYFTRDKAVLSFTTGKRGVALHLTPQGANPRAELVPGQQAAGRVNYLDGSRDHTNLPTYRTLTYRDLWPGIDMVFRGQGAALKYEFRVRPGADPAKIRLNYAGAQTLSVSRSGGLLIGTNLGTLRDSAPLTYQVVNGRRVAVDSRFRLDGGTAYGFALGSSYDPAKPLVIDPELVYSTYLGGGSRDEGYGIAVDGDGSAYVTGLTFSPNFPTTPGAFDTTFTDDDGFVTKLNPSGTAVVYSTYLGQTDIEGRGIGVDDAGSAYVTGLRNNGISYDAFVTKLNPSGSTAAYSVTLGGQRNEEGHGIAVDGSGNAYVTGFTQSSDFPVTAGAFDTIIGGSDSDAFVAKLSPTGSVVYSTFLGPNSGAEGAEDIAIDSSGGAYVVGSTNSASFPTTPGAFDTMLTGPGDAFITKLNPAGSALSYSTFLDGANIRAIAVGGDANAYVTGSANADLPTTPGAFDTTPPQPSDDDEVFVARLNAPGSSLAYSTFIGGNENEGGHGIDVDVDGRAYVAGWTASSNFPTTPDAFDTTLTGPGIFKTDAFLTTFTPSGSGLAYSTFIGGNNDTGDIALDVDVDDQANAYLTGRSRDFPTTPVAYDTAANGLDDAFVAKLGSAPGFPRPKGATPLRASLVLAYTPCSSSNRTHGPPLAHPSCNPPAQASPHLTVGTADSNPFAANFVGSVRLGTVSGNPSTPADEADVRFTISLTDVRRTNLADYIGELLSSQSVRLTDRLSGPAQDQPATVQDFPFEFAVPCTATADPDIGSTCGIDTTADAVTPGAVTELKRSIWQVGQIQVFDGGSDGVASTTPNTLFAVQGVFVP